jgi:hypothetical protein
VEARAAEICFEQACVAEDRAGETRPAKVRVVKVGIGEVHASAQVRLKIGAA